MGVIDFCLKKPILVAVVVFFVLMAGIWALISIPIQLTPDVELPTLRVRTIWPGASPYEVEREIVREQEQYLNNLQGLVRLTSEAQPNQANITLEFKIGTDIDDALLGVFDVAESHGAPTIRRIPCVRPSSPPVPIRAPSSG